MEQILSHESRRIRKSAKKGKTRYKNYYYLIKWKGYGPAHNSWEPEQNLNEAALLDYLAKQPELKGVNPNIPSNHVPGTIKDVEQRGDYVSSEVVTDSVVPKGNKMPLTAVEKELESNGTSLRRSQKIKSN
jgi:hypothetical protein